MCNAHHFIAWVTLGCAARAGEIVQPVLPSILVDIALLFQVFGPIGAMLEVKRVPLPLRVKEEYVCHVSVGFSPLFPVTVGSRALPSDFV